MGPQDGVLKSCVLYTVVLLQLAMGKKNKQTGGSHQAAAYEQGDIVLSTLNLSGEGGRTIALCSFSQGLPMTSYIHLQRTCGCQCVCPCNLYIYGHVSEHYAPSTVCLCHPPPLFPLSVPTIFCCLSVIKRDGRK